jgi:hypothetical protein
LIFDRFFKGCSGQIMGVLIGVKFLESFTMIEIFWDILSAMV